MQFELGKAPKQLCTEPESQRNLKQLHFHFTNEKTEAQEVNNLAKSPGKKVRELGQGFRLPVSISRIEQYLIKSNTCATELVVLIRIGNWPSGS